MQLPLAHLDAAAIEEVSIELWRNLFDEFGWPDSLAGKHDSFSHGDILHAFERDRLSDGILQALEVLHTLGTEAGRDAIAAAMVDQRIPMDALPAGTSEREIALHLFLGQRKNASLADVFARAQIQVQEVNEQRRYNEFLGKEPRMISELDAKREALRVETLQYCLTSDLGEHVQVQAFEDNGTYVFCILRSHHTKKPLAVVPGQSGRATIEFRPVHGDMLRYESHLGRLRIAARASSIVEFYRRALGKAVFADETFFDGAPVCSLAVLQERGRTALENHGIFGVGRVWMTECQWERGDRNIVSFRSDDCFRSIEELHLPLKEGTFIQAKFKFETRGKSTRPIIVNVRTPSRIEVRPEHEQLANRVLKAIGVRDPAPQSPETNVWSLYPWRDEANAWRAVFGKEMDALVRNGVLTPVQLESARHPDHPTAGRVLSAQAVSEGSAYGVSLAEEIPSRSLSATDLDGLELNPEQFRLYLRSRLGIIDGGTPWKDGEIFDLGFIEVGTQRLYLSYAIREPKAGIGDRMRANAKTAHPVLLLPVSHSDSSELARVVLESPLPSRAEVIRGAIAACGLADDLPAIHTSPDDARLVVDTRHKRIWVDGLEITGIQPDTHAFRFIQLLAQSPCPVSKDKISTELSQGRQDDTTTARHAKMTAKRLILDAMAAAGREFTEEPFPNSGTGFYRCALVPYVR